MSNFDFFNNKTEIIFHRKFINFQFYFWRFTIFFSWIIFPVLDMLKLENSCSDGSFWKILYKTSFFLISVKHQQTMKNNLLPVIFYPNIRFFLQSDKKVSFSLQSSCVEIEMTVDENITCCVVFKCNLKLLI